MDLFALLDIVVGYETYVKNFIKIKEKILDLGKRSADDKEYVLKAFSSQKWQQLTDGQKRKHTFFGCKECLRDNDLRSALRLIPISKKDVVGMKRAKEGGLFRPLKDEVQAKTATILKELNTEYRTNFATTFEHQYRLVKQQKTKTQV